MRITKIIEKPVQLKSNISNALVNFSEHTVSLLAVVTDKVVDGKPLVGLSFNSIGRYAQSGIINARMAPRVLAAPADSLLQDGEDCLSPEKVLACAIKNEKPGGHGDRAAAASAIELAVWDLNAKLRSEPASHTIARHYGLVPQAKVRVYAAGGYYYDGDGAGKLEEELVGYGRKGFNKFKIKVGGAPLRTDLNRIETAIKTAGSGSNIAVDANGRFNLTDALEYAKALQDYGLMWFEEIGDPLDYELNSLVAQAYSGAIATGENLFSRQDVKNLLLFGGMRPNLDIFQMDSGLSYGITEYAKMLHEMESRGFGRAQACPHGGQLMALHVVAGLRLGGCEVYPSIFQPMGGFGDQTVVVDGQVSVPQDPGFGFEAKSNLIYSFAQMLAR